jgi:hypothetical protein
MSDRGVPDRDPHYDPKIRNYDTSDSVFSPKNNGESMVWVLVVLVVAVVVGVMIFNISDLSKATNTPVPETTGQSNRTIGPAPRVNPGPQNTVPTNPVPAPQPSDRL